MKKTCLTTYRYSVVSSPRRHTNNDVRSIFVASINPWSVSFNSGIGDKLKHDSVINGACKSHPSACAAASSQAISRITSGNG